MAIDFDKVADYYAIADDASLTLTEATGWSVGIWAHVTYPAGTRFHYLISVGVPGTTNNFNLYHYEGLSGVWVSSALDSTGTDQAQMVSAAVGSSSTWRLIVVTYNPGGNPTLWLCTYGGTPVGVTDTVHDLDGDINGGTWNIGRRSDGSTSRYFGGTACEVFKIDVELTEEEITALGAGRTVLDLGYTPDMYLPMRTPSAPLVDIVGPNDATEFGTPVTAEHAPVHGGFYSQYIEAPPVVAGGNEGAAMYHHLQNLGAY